MNKREMIYKLRKKGEKQEASITIFFAQKRNIKPMKWSLRLDDLHTTHFREIISEKFVQNGATLSFSENLEIVTAKVVAASFKTFGFFCVRTASGDLITLRPSAHIEICFLDQNKQVILAEKYYGGKNECYADSEVKTTMHQLESLTHVTPSGESIRSIYAQAQQELDNIRE